MPTAKPRNRRHRRDGSGREERRCLLLTRLHYELAAEIEPNFPDLYFNLGLVHAIGGGIEEAIAALRKAREKAPDAHDEETEEFLAGLLKASADTQLR